MMDLLASPQAWLSLCMLTFMEIILGIDNIIFIAIVASKLPKHQQAKARAIGLTLALVFRCILLSTISILASLTQPVLAGFSWRDIILLGGGIFLLYKTIKEIIEKFSEAGETEASLQLKVREGFANSILQIVLIDIVFSFDSILTAVGLSNQLPIMIGAVICSMIIMLIISAPISDFLNRYPTLKMLALVFLIAIALLLIAEGIHFHAFDKSYIYFAMVFSLIYECLNIFLKQKQSQQKRTVHTPQ